MSDAVTTEIGSLDLPYSRKVTVKRADFPSGLSMVRLVFREGKRITQIDLDQTSADRLARLMGEADLPQIESQ